MTQARLAPYTAGRPIDGPDVSCVWLYLWKPDGSRFPRIGFESVEAAGAYVSALVSAGESPGWRVSIEYTTQETVQL